MTCPKACTASEILFLSKLRDRKDRRKVLAAASPDQIKFLRNICYNILYTKVFPLTEGAKRKLKPHLKTIRYIADRKSPHQSIRKRFIQSGGFLNLILPLVMSVLGSLAGKLIGKAIPA